MSSAFFASRAQERQGHDMILGSQQTTNGIVAISRDKTHP